MSHLGLLWSFLVNYLLWFLIFCCSNVVANMSLSICGRWLGGLFQTLLGTSDQRPHLAKQWLHSTNYGSTSYNRLTSPQKLTPFVVTSKSMPQRHRGVGDQRLSHATDNSRLSWEQSLSAGATSNTCQRVEALMVFPMEQKSGSNWLVRY